jgi:hypothetical protein
MTGRTTRTLHTFYEMSDGSYLAFFGRPTCHAQATDPARNEARAKLDRWQASKQPA